MGKTVRSGGQLRHKARHHHERGRHIVTFVSALALFLLASGR
jgi:hypothetical protein